MTNRALSSKAMGAKRLRGTALVTRHLLNAIDAVHTHGHDSEEAKMAMKHVEYAKHLASKDSAKKHSDD